MGSCSSMKYQWGNFTAYYNTFFNADQSFEKGYQASLKAQPVLNTEKPIRVTEIPSKAGFTDFDKAIEKSAKILREYDKSKWVDDALFLIGKSYFFQMNYFSAEEKFIELMNNSADLDLKQQAIFWRARTFYETKRYDEALALINEELSAIDTKWSAANKAQVELIEAETYVELEDYYKAEALLENALPRLKQKEYKAKGWYLKGQLHERNNENEKALEAYSKVKSYTNDYNLQFLAKRKQAEIARLTNQLDKALELFVDMSNDGKNYDVIADLNYEIGRTLQLKGEYKKAESVYKELLYNRLKAPGKETSAKTHFGLAEIHRDNYKDLLLTAAYFDSANTRAGNSELLPEWFNAAELSKYYGAYARLHKKNVRFDSLLYLSTLNPAQLDSVILEIQEIRKKELELLKKQQEKANSTLAVVNSNPNQNNPQQQEGTQLQNGFLNHKNPMLVQQAKDQFMALWGNRPLVDNWRRADAIKNVMVSNQNSGSDKQGTQTKNNQQELQALKIDLAEIPFDSAKKVQFINDFAANLYETGNVFYLNLNQADSAKNYYTRIIQEFPESKVLAQTQFTLSELYFSKGDSIKARDLAFKVTTKYPETAFASVLSQKYNFEVSDSTTSKSPKEQLNDFAEISSTLPPKARAEELRRLSSLIKDKELSALLLKEAAYSYVEDATNQNQFPNKLALYDQKRNAWNDESKAFKTLKDSAKTMLTDSTIIADSVQFTYYKHLVDSTLKTPDLSAYFPYLGADWDSSRSILASLKVTYASTQAAKNTDLLRAEITLPESLKPQKVNPSLTDSTSKKAIKLNESGFQVPTDTLKKNGKKATNSRLDSTSRISPTKKDSIGIK